jgi:hypothetical protein
LHMLDKLRQVPRLRRRIARDPPGRTGGTSGTEGAGPGG